MNFIHCILSIFILYLNSFHSHSLQTPFLSTQSWVSTSSSSSSPPFPLSSYLSPPLPHQPHLLFILLFLIYHLNTDNSSVNGGTVCLTFFLYPGFFCLTGEWVNHIYVVTILMSIDIQVTFGDQKIPFFITSDSYSLSTPLHWKVLGSRRGLLHVSTINDLITPIVYFSMPDG